MASNIRRHRGALSLRDLSSRLAQAGHPISLSSLQKIEAGNRRVHVDDLMAIAIALGVSPTRLLVEPVEAGESVRLTGMIGSVRPDIALAWARDELELTADPEADRARLVALESELTAQARREQSAWSALESAREGGKGDELIQDLEIAWLREGSRTARLERERTEVFRRAAFVLSRGEVDGDD